MNASSLHLTLSSDITRQCANTIVISGAARSGTTILAKLLHSLENVEYIFEPPLLYSLIPLINKVDPDSWKLLYETYLYEEFLVGAVTGRNINCNRHDDSSIFHAKSEQDVANRLAKSWRKHDAIEASKQRIIAYKMPDIAPYLRTLEQYYSLHRFIIIYRDTMEVLNSLVEKHWFSDENLKRGNIAWPNYRVDDFYVPFWVGENDQLGWLKMNELDRAGYYLLSMLKGYAEIKNSIIVNYHDLLMNPGLTLEKLSETLGLQLGDKSKSIIQSVKSTEKNRDSGIINKLSADIKEAILEAISVFEK